MLGEGDMSVLEGKKMQRRKFGVEWNGGIRFQGVVNPGLLLTSPRSHAPDRGARLQRDRCSK